MGSDFLPLKLHQYSRSVINTVGEIVGKIVGYVHRFIECVFECVCVCVCVCVVSDTDLLMLAGFTEGLHTHSLAQQQLQQTMTLRDTNNFWCIVIIESCAESCVPQSKLWTN